MNRRIFLSGLGAGMVASNLTYGVEPTLSKEKALIFVWLSGGISDIDFINPLPTAPLEIRSNRGFVKTKNGEYLGGDMKLLAAQSDKWTVVRNFHHRDANHQSATSWTMTSEPNFNNKSNNFPSHGSLISWKKGFANNGVPTYTQLSKIEGDGPAWLGAGHMGYKVDLQGATNLTPSFQKGKLDQRLKMIDIIEKTKPHLPQEWIDLRNKAVEMIYGNTSKALDLSQVPQDIIKKYKADSSQIGKDLLIAQRLVQAGASYVNVSLGGWDMHNNISDGFERKGTELDYCLSNLVSDLEIKGLLDKTLIVVASEFGRTHKINTQGGRDHKAACNSLLFAGGGHDHNKFIGKTDAIGSQVDGESLDPKDLSWTIADHFGLDKGLVINDNANRPRPIFNDDAKNIVKG
jgi:hypothetical protein